MKKAPKTCFFLCGLLLTAAFFTTLYSEENLHRVWAVKDCRIVTQAGAPIEKGTVLIRDGLIQAMGTSVDIPADAEILDGSTLTVYPGLTDALGSSLLKLPEEKFDIAKIYTGQYTDKDRGITPELRSFDHFQISKAALQKYHESGITTVQVMPERGLLTGQASVFSLSGQNKQENIVLRDNCFGIGFSPANFMVYPNSLMGVVSCIRQQLADSSHFQMHTSRWQKEMRGISRPQYNAKSEAMADFATGKKPVIFLCRNQFDIKRALSLASELNLDYFICDKGSEAFRVIPELKKARARVLCTLEFKVPPTSIHAQKGRDARERAEKELYIKNPAKLAEAGIPFAFSSLGTDDPKSFIEGVHKAVENGLPQDKALDALTVTPAQFLGLEKALGTVEPGKMANLILVEGEILTKDAKIKHIFADGKKFDIEEAKVKEGEKPTVNVSGKWEFMIEGVGMKVMIVFIQEGASLSGKMTLPLGVFDFTGGSVTGNEIYFETTLSIGGQELDLYFSATVEGDKMTGSVVQGTEGAAEFTAKRVPG